MTHTPKIIQAKTQDYLLTQLDGMTHKVFTNNGARSDITFTLPPAAIGYRFSFRKVSNGGNIYINSSGHKIVAGARQGHSILLKASGGVTNIRTDPSGSQWIKDNADDGLIQETI